MQSSKIISHNNVRTELYLVIPLVAYVQQRLYHSVLMIY